MFSNSEGDAGIEQFRTLVNCPMNALKFKSFSKVKIVWTNSILKHSIEKLLQPLFVLHNDQAEVERGFSINKALLENSMKGETITSRRRVKDYMYAYKLELYQVRKYKYFADRAVYCKYINHTQTVQVM